MRPSAASVSKAHPAIVALRLTGVEDDEDADSLGDLSDFEDADFEAFADSLLESENLEDALFGYGLTSAGRKAREEHKTENPLPVAKKPGNYRATRQSCLLNAWTRFKVTSSVRPTNANSMMPRS